MRVHSEAEGLYKIEGFKIDKEGNEIPGSRNLKADWFPNLITNGGLDAMATNGNFIYWCQVGTGSTAPAFTDTSLVSFIGGTNTLVTSATNGAQNAEPYYSWTNKTFRFGEGVAAGNLTEVGVGWASPGSLFSRALILDGVGNPTTITVEIDEWLDVSYEFRFYPKLIATSGTIAFSGSEGQTYAWEAKPKSVTSSATSGGWSPTSIMNTLQSANWWYAYTGEPGAITGSPSGLISGGATSISVTSYVPGTYIVYGTVTWGLDKANHADGIRCVAGSFGKGAYQYRFGQTGGGDQTIPKTASTILSIEFSHSWGRKT